MRILIRGRRAWLGRLVLAGLLVQAAAFLMVHFLALREPGRVIQHTAPWIMIPLIIIWAASRTSQALRLKPDGAPEVTLLAQQALLLGAGAAWALEFLATQGNSAALGVGSAHVNSSGFLPDMESWALAQGLLYALLFAPEKVRRKLPFEHASEQALRLVPAVHAVGAAIVTGAYLLALHFFNQPLARIPPGPLAASIVAVMAFLAPFYQLIARACWRYGLADLLDPAAWLVRWREVTSEIALFRHNQELRLAEEKRSADAKEMARSVNSVRRFLHRRTAGF